MHGRINGKIVFCICALVFMAAFIGVLGMLLNDALPSNKTTAKPASSSSVDGSRRGPYTLVRTFNDVGKTLYTSFDVYAPAAKSGEKADLVFKCGRQFVSLDVKSIAWSGDDSYNIIVSMKNGEMHTFTFDGNAGWQ